MKRKRGRPKLPPAIVVSRRITLRMTPVIYDRLAAAYPKIQFATRIRRLIDAHIEELFQ